MTPYELTLRRPFVADHFHDLPGFLEARHGHNWELEATVRLEDGGAERAFQDSLDGWIEKTDYSLLNDRPRLAARNPTAELLAQWAFEHLAESGLDPVRVRIREKVNYWAACEGVAR